MLKLKVIVEAIYFPKNTTYINAGQYAIFLARIKDVLEGEYSLKTIKIKGVVSQALQQGDTLVLSVEYLQTHAQFGKEYGLVSIDIDTNLSDRQKQKNFLSSIVTSAMADKIIDTIPNITEVLEQSDVHTLSQVRGIGQIKAVQIIEKYHSIKEYADALSVLSGFGLSKNTICKIVDFYGNSKLAVQIVMSNPYDLTKIRSIGFRIADAIARKVSLPDFEIKRIDGFINHILAVEGERGKSYLEYRALLKTIKKYIAGITEDILDARLNVLEQSGDIIRLGDNNKISLATYYQLEHDIAQELIRIYNHYNNRESLASTPQDVIAYIEAEKGISLTEKQKATISLSTQYGVIAVTGLAGTGKTTSAYGICLLHRNKKIMTVALSGKASIRIAEVTGIEPHTIHKLLGYSRGKFLHNQNNPLDVDLLIVDEATMINGDLFLALLQAVPNGAQIILYGDVQQLAPIGNCNVFSDILQSNIFPCLRLTEPHRQALRGGIIPTSLQIANQQPIFDSKFTGVRVLGELEDMEINIFHTSERILETVAKVFQREYNKNPNILEVQIITPMKLHGAINCYAINNLIQSIYNPDNNTNTCEVVVEQKKNIQKKYTIKIGDKVINTKNNYHSYNLSGTKTPIFNGNIGIVTAIEQNSCVVDFIGIGEVLVTKENIQNLELAYAITVHKSEGSGFENIIVVIDGSGYILNNVELLYTALTRAESFCSLIATNKAIQLAIRTKEVSNKQTLLKNILIKNGGALYL